MKQAVYYLYEYEENRQMRNVGFVKCQHKGQQAVFQIHGKGLSCNQGEEYEMNLFSGAKDRCYISRAGHVQTQTGKISYMVTVDEVEESIFEDYDGLYIHGEGETKYVAMWNAKKVVFDQIESFGMMKESVPEEEDELTQVRIIRNGEKYQETDDSYNHDEEEPGHHSVQDTHQEDEVVEQVAELERELHECPIEAEECCYDAIRRKKEEEKRNHDSHGETKETHIRKESDISYEKIERQDIAKLPQREWRLANNSFLLHGYHNYQHILFIQEAGRSFIGVPGVYSAREADAAKNFGFPVFHRIEPGQMEWEEEEYDQEADFGYWCKEVSYRNVR